MSAALELTSERGTAERSERTRAVYEIRVMRTCAVEESAAVLGRAEVAADFWRSVVAKAEWFDADKECVVVVILNRKNRVTGYNLVSLGGLTGTVMHPREVLRPVIVGAGAAFMVMHNHPSGDPAPSSADVTSTQRLNEAARAVDIPLIDHVIVGAAAFDPLGRGYYSLREAGLI